METLLLCPLISHIRINCMSHLRTLLLKELSPLMLSNVQCMWYSLSVANGFYHQISVKLVICRSKEYPSTVC